MNKVTAVVLTKNEEKNITRCLDSLKWCDEVIVIDDISTDKTTNLVRNMGVKTILNKLDNNFAQQHNFAMDKAKHDWILFIDADEVVSSELRNSIKDTLKDPQYDAYSITRKNVFLHKTLNYGEWGNSKITRLVKKSTGKWKRSVHEYWETKSAAGILKGDLLHYSPRDINSLIEKMGRYSELHSKEVLIEGKAVSLIKLLLFPLAKFIKNYIIEQGFRDGVRGFIMAVALSFHSFLSWSNLWINKN